MGSFVPNDSVACPGITELPFKILLGLGPSGAADANKLDKDVVSNLSKIGVRSSLVLGDLDHTREPKKPTCSSISVVPLGLSNPRVCQARSHGDL